MSGNPGLPPPSPPSRWAPWLASAATLALATYAFWRLALLPTDYMPHGVCFMREPPMMRLHVSSDLGIWAAYVGISCILGWVLWQRRRDLPAFLLWIGAGFVLFVFSCGQTHLFDVITVWIPTYWVSGGAKAFTAVVSVATFGALVYLAPSILRIPSPRLLEAANEQLRERTNEAVAALADAQRATGNAIAAKLEAQTLRREAEQHAEELARRNAVIERQAAEMLAQSAPVLPVDAGMLAVPIIGTLGSERASQISEALLAAIDRDRADTVILDLSGVPVVDTATAMHLIEMLQGARLLGATGYLTGIKPHVAQAMVKLGVDLRTVTTYGTLAKALKRVARVEEPGPRKSER